MDALSCMAPLRSGPHKGATALGTWAGYKRHLRRGEPPCEECRQASVAKAQRWQKANPSAQAQNVRRYVARHPERSRERWRTRDAANRAVRRLRNQGYRAAKRGVRAIPFSREQLDARLSMFGHRCWMCGGPYEHVDHVKPISAGGWHCLANLRPSCAKCNLVKGGRWPIVA